MSSGNLKCSLCGFLYNPDQHAACQSCPMHKDCNLVCCPACGYQTVNPQHSLLGRMVRHFPKPRRKARVKPGMPMGISLADIPPGIQAQVIGFSDDFPEDRRAYLQAYGLVINHQVRVVQHSPVTIIRFDNIELALEAALAEGIRVQVPRMDKG
jgi:Fe2+ transport system protein FeoA